MNSMIIDKYFNGAIYSLVIQSSPIYVRVLFAFIFYGSKINLLLSLCNEFISQISMSYLFKFV